LIFSVVSLSPILAGLYFYLKNAERFHEEFESFKALANKFLEKDATQQILFYIIILLFAVSLLIWIFFVILPKNLDTKSDITEYFADLSFASFREKLGVSTDLLLIILHILTESKKRLRHIQFGQKPAQLTIKTDFWRM
jgi:hypothetical protein